MASDGPAWSLQLLGRPRLVSGRDDTPVKVPFRRLMSLLGLLATSPGRQCAREEVLQRLWERKPPAVAKRNLHPTVSHLRRLLGPAADGGHHVRLESGLYTLSAPDEIACDVDRFLVLADSEAVPDRLEAWQGYRGDFMEEFSETWVVERRDELRDRYFDLLEGLGGDLAEAGRVQEAEDAYRTLLAQDPLQEHIYLEVMALYRAQSRRDLVHRLYERMCRVLLREVGTQPLDSTIARYEQLMAAQDP